MGVHIQVRDVPDEVFLALKARATGSGRSLSEYLCDLFEQAVAGTSTRGQTGVPAPRPWTDRSLVLGE